MRDEDYTRPVSRDGLSEEDSSRGVICQLQVVDMHINVGGNTPYGNT